MTAHNIVAKKHGVKSRSECPTLRESAIKRATATSRDNPEATSNNRVQLWSSVGDTVDGATRFDLEVHSTELLHVEVKYPCRDGRSIPVQAQENVRRSKLSTMKRWQLDFRAIVTPAPDLFAHL